VQPRPDVGGIDYNVLMMDLERGTVREDDDVQTNEEMALWIQMKGRLDQPGFELEWKDSERLDETKRKGFERRALY
jgi:hypothetical protein